MASNEERWAKVPAPKTLAELFAFLARLDLRNHKPPTAPKAQEQGK